jgi:branched-subunit amino acid transport protein
MLIQNGSPDFSIGNSRLLAGLLAIGVAWVSRSTLLTILIGMVALWGLEALQ